MAQQIIDNSGPDADSLKTGADKINANFTELYSIGVSGYSGYSGYTGPSGSVGSSGYSGYSGVGGQDLTNRLSYKVTGSGSSIPVYTDGTYALSNTYVYQAAYPNAGTTFGSIDVSNTTLYCLPSIQSANAVIRRLGVNKLTTTTGNIKLGVYSNTGTNQPYPYQLLYDAGEWTLTHNDVDLEYKDVNYTIPSDDLYWFCFKFSSTPRLQAPSAGHDIPFLGWAMPPGNNQFISGIWGIWFTTTYGDALPSTMDNSGLVVGTMTSLPVDKRAIPHIFIGYDVAA